MSFRATMTSAIRAVSRPRVVVPAAALAALAFLSPAVVDVASAQGFGMQRSGFSGGAFSNRGLSSSPFARPMVRPTGMSGGPMSKAGLYPKSIYPKAGLPRPPGGNIATGPSRPNYPKRPGRPPRPTGDTAGTNDPLPCLKRAGCYPKRPHRPPILIPGGTTVVAVPVPVPSAPPPAYVSGGGGGGRSSAPPPRQSDRRPSRSAPPAVPFVSWGRYVPNEVVVETAPNIPSQTIDALLRRHGLTELETVTLQSSGTSIRRLRINNNRAVPAVVRALAADGAIMGAQPNLIATLQDTRGAQPAADNLEQYALARMRMPEAHALARGDQVLIAVIDSGADTTHPELAGMILDSFDAIGSGDPVHAHGTSVVGAIVARARLRGTAPGAHILVARAFGTTRASMDGTSFDIIKSLDWAMARGARIINMSFAGARDPAIERRLNEARNRGIILVAAAGNAGPRSAPLYPAANSAVIAVTATDDGDRIYRMANRGNHIAVAAPGVDLLLPTVDGDYRMTSGTSFSAAEITGVIALMLERNPSLTPDAVRRALSSTARDLGDPGADPLFGAGLVDAYQAVRSVMPAAAAAGTPTTVGAGGQ